MTLGREQPRIIWNGTIVPLDSLKHRADKYDMLCTSLSRNLRWGGLQRGTINVASHSYLVYKETLKRWPKESLLAYNALLHEVEEAFGVGDIVTEVKHALFPDRYYYDKFKDMLAKQFDLDMLKDPRIKEMDILVGMAEALTFLENPADLMDLYNNDAQVKQLVLANAFDIEELSAHIIVNLHLYSKPSYGRIKMLDALRELNFGEKLYV